MSLLKKLAEYFAEYQASVWLMVLALIVLISLTFWLKSDGPPPPEFSDKD